MYLANMCCGTLCSSLEKEKSHRYTELSEHQTDTSMLSCTLLNVLVDISKSMLSLPYCEYMYLGGHNILPQYRF